MLIYLFTAKITGFRLCCHMLWDFCCLFISLFLNRGCDLFGTLPVLVTFGVGTVTCKGVLEEIAHMGSHLFLSFHLSLSEMWTCLQILPFLWDYGWDGQGHNKDWTTCINIPLKSFVSTNSSISLGFRSFSSSELITSSSHCCTIEGEREGEGEREKELWSSLFCFCLFISQWLDRDIHQPEAFVKKKMH